MQSLDMLSPQQVNVSPGKMEGKVFEGAHLGDIASPSAQVALNPILSPAFTVAPAIHTPNSAQSPGTPLGDMIKKVNATPGPWSKSLLQQAEKLQMSGTHIT